MALELSATRAVLVLAGSACLSLLSAPPASAAVTAYAIADHCASPRSIGWVADSVSSETWAQVSFGIIDGGPELQNRKIYSGHYPWQVPPGASCTVITAYRLSNQPSGPASGNTEANGGPPGGWTKYLATGCATGFSAATTAAGVTCVVGAPLTGPACIAALVGAGVTSFCQGVLYGLQENSPDWILLSTEGDSAVPSTLSIPFAVTNQGDGDWLSFAIDGQEFWRQPLANFNVNEIHYADVPTSLLVAGTSPIFTFYLESTGQSGAGVLFSFNGPDSDSDGFVDLADNCPFSPNGGQLDAGGIGAGSAPDGIGDACQCGDVTGNGSITTADAVAVTRSLLVPPTSVLSQPALCDVGGSAGCSTADAVIVTRAVLVPPTATIQQKCAPALKP
jgi:hypothetical protein